jgi:hypothetical protein
MSEPGSGHELQVGSRSEPDLALDGTAESNSRFRPEMESKLVRVPAYAGRESTFVPIPERIVDWGPAVDVGGGVGLG